MITIDRDPGSAVCVARLEGDLDFSTVPELRRGIDTVIEGGCNSIVMDFSGVSYADSSALGLLVWLDKRLQSRAGRLIVAGADGNVSRVLELSGLLGVAPCVSAAASVEDALGGLSPRVDAGEPLWVRSFEAPAALNGMSDIRSRVIELVSPLGMSEASLFDVKVAVGEALANAVRHGSPGGETDVVGIEVRAFLDRVEVGISDHGVGFSGDAECSTDTYASSGRGVLFMRALMDQVEFTRCDGHGTYVRLVKRLPRPAGSTPLAN
jgi:serine/threonine-protein kinase RsbW